jgi:hypothetical protein
MFAPLASVFLVVRWLKSLACPYIRDKTLAKVHPPTFETRNFDVCSCSYLVILLGAGSWSY